MAEGKYASDAQEAGADRVDLDEIINEIKGGKIDFDILLTAPRFVPRLAPVARVSLFISFEIDPWTQKIDALNSKWNCVK